MTGATIAFKVLSPLAVFLLTAAARAGNPVGQFHYQGFIDGKIAITGRTRF